MFKTLTNLIETQNIKLISFDIFDTLILRPFAKPEGLFSLIEIQQNIKGFKEARVKAEVDARRKASFREITIHQIYANIPEEYKGLLDIELQSEIDNTFINDEMKEIFDYAIKKDIPVIITSDMYLPKYTILDILKNNGIIGFRKLYLSSEYKKSKADGFLYQEIIKDFPDINSNKILHIGDNFKADIESASKHGLKTFFYPSIKDQFIKQYPRIKKLDTSVPENNLMLGKMLLAWKKSFKKFNELNYWGRLGFLYSGAFCLTFTEYINNVINKENIDKVLFIARDGYTLNKTYKILYDGVDSAYIYCPRAFKKYLNTNNDKITEFKSYLNSVNGGSKNIAMVDTIAYNYTGQSLLNEVCDNDYLGIYWITQRQSSLKHCSLVNDEKKDSIDQSLRFKCWNFIEFLITSPEAPISGMIGHNPIYKEDISHFEKNRMSIYTSIDEGACLLVKTIKELSLKTPSSREGTISWINLFLDTPTLKDHKYFENIRFASDSSHQEYLPLLCSKLNNPFKTNVIKRLFWKTPAQTFWINTLSPLHFSLKNKELVIFPYWKPKSSIKILGWSLSIGPND